MADSTLFYNATACAETGLQAQSWVHVTEGRIVGLGQGAAPTCPGAERVDVGGHILAPGLIDLHVHGALGHDTMDATPDALCRIARFLARHGVTAFLATTVTAPAEAILAALRNVAHVMRSGTGGAMLLGAHVEGPYLDAARHGAQVAHLVRPPTLTEYAALFATGVVKLITLAPEVPENEPLIRYAVEHGARVAAGHTRASYAAMSRAVELGVTQVTHLFNGMEPLHHREPGAVGAALTLEELRCQLIADNVHVHPAVLKLAVRAKGLDGILLISDAMRGAGMPDGVYDLGGQAVTVRQGIARTAEGALAGSTLTLERAVGNIMAAAGVTLAEALRMATRNPAQALGLSQKGSLAVGQDADIIILDDALEVRLTMVQGRIVI